MAIGKSFRFHADAVAALPLPRSWLGRVVDGPGLVIAFSGATAQSFTRRFSFIRDQSMRAGMPGRKRNPYSPPEPWTEIERTVDGKVYKGRYQVDDGTLTVVLHGHHGEEKAHVGGSNVEVLAGIMFATLITKSQRSITQ